MEVVVAENKEQHGKGRLGTLENPEAYANVPGNVIPIIEREFDDFDNEAEKFLEGQTPEDQFIGFRLKQGGYGQRQPDGQMDRVNVPYGGVPPEPTEGGDEVRARWGRVWGPPPGVVRHNGVERAGLRERTAALPWGGVTGVP